ncbi:AraC family transcriptional regulator [Erysipelotrichaceae bacterium MTC7]|nr:AraC family transcriptional regulator [Erysipelotrichaceae bacterium MTC7]
MFKKTTSYIFQKYGEIFQDFSYGSSILSPGKKIKKINNKSIDFLYYSNSDTYIRVNEGIVLLVVQSGDYEIEKFVVHRVVRLEPGIKFNFICITSSAKIEISTTGSYTKNRVKLEEPIVYQPIRPRIFVEEVLACYYQVRNTSYSFAGEITNHWELTFIDNGELQTRVEEEDFELGQYDLMIYMPNQFHNQYTKADQTCSYLTVMFDMQCDKEHVETLNQRVFKANREILDTINLFVKTSNGDEPYQNELLVSYLEQILIRLIYFDSIDDTPVKTSPMQQKFENELLNEILIFINDNIYSVITIESLCNEFNISRSSLQQLFKTNLNTAPKQYISDLKLNRSKQLIKESKYTISEISNILGFASIHYFSRKFKQQFGITPSDYAKTIYN